MQMQKPEVAERTRKKRIEIKRFKSDTGNRDIDVWCQINVSKHDAAGFPAAADLAKSSLVVSITFSRGG